MKCLKNTIILTHILPQPCISSWLVVSLITWSLKQNTWEITPASHPDKWTMKSINSLLSVLLSFFLGLNLGPNYL